MSSTDAELFQISTNSSLPPAGPRVRNSLIRMFGEAANATPAGATVARSAIAKRNVEALRMVSSPLKFVLEMATGAAGECEMPR
jgi:hypothetical protein